MAKYTKIEIWGGFHNQMTPVVVRVPSEAIENGMHIGDILHTVLSDGQRKKVNKHMCSSHGCWCSFNHGWQWSEK